MEIHLYVILLTSFAAVVANSARLFLQFEAPVHRPALLLY